MKTKMKKIAILGVVVSLLTAARVAPVAAEIEIREPVQGITLLYHVYGLSGSAATMAEGWAETWAYKEYGSVNDDELLVTRRLGAYSTLPTPSEMWEGILNLHTADWYLELIGSGEQNRIAEIWDDILPSTVIPWPQDGTAGVLIDTGPDVYGTPASELFTPIYAGKAYAILPSNVLGRGRKHGIQDLFYTISSPPTYWSTFVQDVAFVEKIKATLDGEDTQILKFGGENRLPFSTLYITNGVFGITYDKWTETTAFYELKTGIMLLGVIKYGRGDTTNVSRYEVRILEDVNDVSVDSSLFSDADVDGLPDAAEGVIGTDPNNPDTDGDGRNDLDEIKYLKDPLAAD